MMKGGGCWLSWTMPSRPCALTILPANLFTNFEETGTMTKALESAIDRLEYLALARAENATDRNDARAAAASARAAISAMRPTNPPATSDGWQDGDFERPPIASGDNPFKPSALRPTSPEPTHE